MRGKSEKEKREPKSMRYGRKQEILKAERLERERWKRVANTV